MANFAKAWYEAKENIGIAYIFSYGGKL